MKNRGIQFHQSTTNKELHYMQSIPKSWIGKKIIALPKALIAGVFKTIYHIARAIFQGIPKLLTGDTSHLKVNIFKAVRDIQEAYGWVSMLFYVKHGAFHVNDSIRHKYAYDKALSDSRDHVLSDRQDAIEEHFSKDAQGTRIVKDKDTFNEFIKTWINETGPKDWKYLLYIRSFLDKENKKHLDDIYDYPEKFFPNEEPYHEENCKLFQELPQEIVDDLVSEISKKDQLYCQYFISLCTDAQKKNLKLSSISKARMEAYFPTSTTEERLKSEKFIHSLSQESIKNNIKNSVCPGYFFSLLSDDQKKNISISKFSEKQMNNFIKHLSDSKLQECFNYFSQEEIQEALCNHVLTNKKAIQVLSNEQLKDLKISQLTKEQIDALTYGYSGEKLDNRMRLFSKEEIQEAIYKGVLVNEKILKRLSNEQLEGLKLSEIIREQQMNYLTSGLTSAELKARMNCFSKEEIQRALYNGILIDKEPIKALSNEQLEGLKISQVRESQKDILLKGLGGEELEARKALFSE